VSTYVLIVLDTVNAAILILPLLQLNWRAVYPAHELFALYGKLAVAYIYNTGMPTSG
jgi:hypothetical protein